MEFTLEKWNKLAIVYVRKTGPYGLENKQAMEQMKKWARKYNLLQENAVLLGIPQDNPTATPPEACRYDACLVMDEDLAQGGNLEWEEDMDENVHIRTGKLEAGDYAIFQIAHTAEDVQRAWQEIFPALQASGYQMTAKPIIERYAERLLRNHQCEICVPIYR
ncbi:DNA gyrase inhibitor [Saccharibacillus sp. O16]|nr:DNA gyrase inhibitor [Saccharibacillus sp. O16]